MIKFVFVLSTLIAVAAIALLYTPCFWKWYIPSCESEYFESQGYDAAKSCWRRDPKLCNSDSEEKIIPFKIKISTKKLEALKTQLNDSINRKLNNEETQRSKQSPLMYDDFRSGFSHKYLYETILPYWKDEYKWSQWEDKLNKFEHFKTNIDGLAIHFMYIKDATSRVDSDEKVIPILLLHGWPGTFFEFYKFIPYFLEIAKKNNLKVELIIPSLPGYGFSDAPELPGLALFETSNIMFKLMYRLGFKESGFYIQGGDWGSIIASFMARMNPKVVKGIHVNMLMEPFADFRYWFKLACGAYVPSLFFEKEEASKVYPYGKKVLQLLRESGYFHLQATKPTTIGAALEDSPVGLAVYVMEKFSVWTSFSFLEELDGGFTKKATDLKKITIDEVLTNVMIYWHTRSITSSMFLYKNSVPQAFGNKCSSSITQVPLGAAYFPNDLRHAPRSILQLVYENILSYTDMPRGGHFAAFEEPKLLADDVLKFLMTTEKWILQKDHSPLKK